MCLRLEIDYTAIYKELDSLMDDNQKPDYSAMIFNSLEELKNYNSKVREERDRKIRMGSKVSRLSQNQFSDD